MALNPAQLQTELYTWLSNKGSYATATAAAQAFAQHYKNYAQSGTDFSFDLVNPITLSEPLLSGTLAPFLSVPGTAPTAALGYGTSISAFWAAAFFATIITHPALLSEISSSVSTPPSVAGLTGGLLAIFAVTLPGETDLTKSIAMASIIHSIVTGTTTVKITGPAAFFPFPIIDLFGPLS